MEKYLPIILILFAWPITSIVIEFIRNLPRYREPGNGTQHIVIIGVLFKAIFLVSGIALLLLRW